MYQTLLLSYDGTREGRQALREGADMAVRCRAQKTHLLAVMRLLPAVAAVDGIIPQEIFTHEQELAQEILDEGVAKLRERGLEAEGHLAFGEPVEQIVATARHLPADLIVLGHRNRSRLSMWWRSSVSASLVEQAPCSILVAVTD